MMVVKVTKGSITVCLSASKVLIWLRSRACVSLPSLTAFSAVHTAKTKVESEIGETAKCRGGIT